MIWCCEMYPPFLTSKLISKRLHSYSGKFIKIITSSNKRFHTSPNLYSMIFILATSTPIMEKHMKLIDCLSEPSSQLTHHRAHRSEEEISAKINTSCSICIRVHGFASCNHNFCQRALPVKNIAKHLSLK